MSHYHVNAGVPKTLVRHLVRQVADAQTNPAVTAVLIDILDTSVSPELTTTTAGEVSQKTEHIIGPYELHDFFCIIWCAGATALPKSRCSHNKPLVIRMNQR
jgi:NAD+ synthase (glutamine-hydrolysing)